MPSLLIDQMLNNRFTSCSGARTLVTGVHAIVAMQNRLLALCPLLLPLRYLTAVGELPALRAWRVTPPDPVRAAALWGDTGVVGFIALRAT